MNLKDMKAAAWDIAMVIERLNTELTNLRQEIQRKRAEEQAREPEKGKDKCS